MNRLYNHIHFVVLLIGLSGYGGQCAYAYPLAVSPQEKNVSVMVTFNDTIDLTIFKKHPKALKRHEIISSLKKNAKKSQQQVRKFLAGRKVRNVRKFWITNALAVTASPEVIAELASFPGIAGIRPQQTFTIPQITHSQSSAVESNLIAIGAPLIWDLGYTGQGVVIASLDTGVDLMHPDLQNRWRGGTNSWFDPIAGTQIPFESDFDDYHGTKTVGIIVGGSAGASAIGVAPDAHWIAARIFDDNGIAWEPDVHSAFEWILDPDGDPNTDDCPDITNIAWGFEKDPNRCIDVFQPDIDNLKQAGIAVICAAGNRGELIGPSSTSPANYSRSFSVGAVESYQPYNIALWSSRGPSCCQNEIFPNVVAPGLNIRTTDFLGYANVTGTSFAGSHVSGAMALLRNAFPNVDVIEIEWALQRTALDLDTPGPDNNYGHGFIDILKAYELISVDLNTDQSIDFHDFGILAEHWGEQNCGQPDWCGRADVNRNSEVTGADLALMSCYWLKR